MLYSVGILLLGILINQGYFVKGKTCPRIEVEYRRYRECNTWCWGHHWVTRPVYVTRYYCSPGYRGSISTGCSTPICNPPCINGGRCVSPNHCDCGDGHQGRTCEQDKTCSYTQPCFPGTCSVRCQCSDGFTGSTCERLTSKGKPEIIFCSSFIMNKERDTSVNRYRFETESAMPDNSTTNVFWVPHVPTSDQINYVNVYFATMYSQTAIAPQRYIANYGLGITHGEVELKVERLPRQDNTIPPIETMRKVCPGTPTRDSPEENVFHCNITDSNFGYLLEHGSNFTLTVTARSGGYRNILNTDTSHIFKQYFVEQSSTKSLRYRFDYKDPIHCQENHSCRGQQAPLSINHDITKVAPLEMSCSGWHDELSGVKMYTYQVYRLTAYHDGTLTEENPDSPIMFHAESALPRDTSVCPNFSYSPPAAGMYSVLIEVADKANNTKYARRIFLYDNTSLITVNTNKNSRLYVSSAENETGNVWQTNLQNENGLGNPIQTVWENHFVNELHEKGKWLNSVKAYQSHLLMHVRRKYVDDKLDDHEGRRTIEGIQNIHGIIKTEIAFKRDHKGGSTIRKEPSKWTNLPNFVDEKYTFNMSRVDGDSVRVWVRVHDIMGNTKVDSTLVSFDSSPPNIDKVSLTKNINGTYPFMSRVDLDIFDLHSGIHKIKWKIISNLTDGHVFQSGDISGNDTKEKPEITQGVCIPNGQCFFFEHHIDINNCWFVVPKSKLKSQITDIHIDVYNTAMLFQSISVQVSDLMSLSGMEDYSGPMNVRITETHANSVRFEWDQSPSCYDRSEILLMYNVSGTIQKMHIHKDARYYDLTGLDPESAYTARFVTLYGQERSNPVSFSFVTGKKEGLTTGVIAGISIVIIVLLGVIIAFVVLWRTGKLNKAKESIYGHFERRRTRRDTERGFNNAHKPHDNKAYTKTFLSSGAEEDHIYLYGNMAVSEIWEITRDRISLIEKITSGRFADIFKASYDCKQNDRRIVVAKVLKESLKEEDELLMKAKINFFANKVGSHGNVLGFIGAVMDNSTLGPMMILEYCEVGPMRNWLQGKKDNISESAIDTLYRFAFDVAKGMNYLASKEIVHKSLAARNVLLTFTLEAKLSGFGPTKESERNDDDPGKERVPIKWMAPECMKTTKNANTESDIWSFGIVLWEIFSLGETPYPGIRSQDVIRKVESGYRMSRPEFSTDLHYQIMKDCWKRDPKSRPCFKSIEMDLAATFNVNQADNYYYSKQNYPEGIIEYGIKRAMEKGPVRTEVRRFLIPEDL